MEIAIYGKGGIGKSAVSANLTAALALRGEKVLQIGCDPKHDSTRLLMHGRNIPTVLDYLKGRPMEKENANDVLKEGFMGCGCVEAGGPKPGVGCAGRGIISSFEFLNRHHVKENYSTVIYDVLGDVVCGGFAVPVRREYADALFLVTSGEFMALYAANNILKGILNFDGKKYARVGGIIFNERKLPGEDGRVERFAKATGLPVVCKIPRSAAFAKAEEAKTTLMELEGFEMEKSIFSDLAERILNLTALYMAKPLDDDALEEIVLNTKSHVSFNFESGKKSAAWAKTASDSGIICETAAETPCGKVPVDNAHAKAAAPYGGTKALEAAPEYISSSRPPLYGCAFNGAATAAVHLTDALIIAHSPRECAFYTWQNISSAGRKNLFNRGILMPSAISPNFECTQMGHAEIVFGGMDSLREHVSSAIKRGYKAVVVISSCVSGIIGDDISDIENMSSDEAPVISISADGDINGDYMDGIRICMHTLAQKLIDPDIKPEGRCVNLVNEASVSVNRDVNYRTISSLLGRMGISVNCRFLGDAATNEVRRFKRAPLNILADTGEDSIKLKEWLRGKYGVCFLDEPFPVGFDASQRFLYKTGSFFGCEDKAREIILEERQKYYEQIQALKPALSGKKIIMTTINSDLDWLISAVSACGMEFVHIGVLNYLHTELSVTNDPDIRERMAEISDISQIYEKIEKLEPDIVVSNYTSALKKGAYITDTLPMTPPAGFYSALSVLKRWARLFEKTTEVREGGWKNDRIYFEKYNG